MAKLPLKEVLAAVDTGSRDLWNELDSDQQKALKGDFYVLNRYVSSVKSPSRDMQEHYVLACNEFFNKHWFVIQSHPALMWSCLCMCSHESKKILFHEWVGFKKKGSSNKITKFLLEIYPSRKESDVECMSQLLSLDDVKELALRHGYDDKAIAKMF